MFQKLINDAQCIPEAPNSMYVCLYGCRPPALGDTLLALETIRGTPKLFFSKYLWYAIYCFQYTNLVNSPGYIYTDTELYYAAKDLFENSLDPFQMIPQCGNSFSFYPLLPPPYTFTIPACF